jgi:multiple sugar transport system permease protein
MKAQPLSQQKILRQIPQQGLWLSNLLLIVSALSLSASHQLELLGSDAGLFFGLGVRLINLMAALAMLLLGSQVRNLKGLCFGISGLALLLVFLDPPLLGLLWSPLALVLGFALSLLIERKNLSEKTMNHLVGWLFILPALILMVLWVYFPALYAFWISLFKNFNYLGKAEFVGLENYQIAFRDPLFLKSLLNTLWYVVGTVPISIFLGIFIAILLNERIRGLAIYRVLYFLPYITALTAAAAVWRWIYNPDIGLLNWLFALEGFKWLTNPNGLFKILLEPLGLQLSGLTAGPSIALISIMIMSVWHFLGYNVVIFLAGLQSIPKEYYEASRIDGANWWQQVRYLTWPLLAPTTFFVLIISLIGSFNVFTQILIMTPTGGILNDTLSAVMYLYFKGFRDFDFGYASALAFILFIFTLLLTLIQRSIFNRRNTFEAEGA